MPVKIEITDPGEIHLLLVEKYQQSSVNIVIRTVIDESFPEEVYSTALNALVKMHPYLSARYICAADAGSFRYFYEELDPREVNMNVTNVEDKAIDLEMHDLSPMRTHLFRHNDGMLYQLNVYAGESRSMLELTCPHIIGEIPSIIILMGELLKNVDQLVNAGNIAGHRHEKYVFNEADFLWDACAYEDLGFKTDNVAQLKTDPWILPKATLERHRLDSTYFRGIKNWLSENNVNATPSDVFYYIAHDVLSNILGCSPEMWLILSYRNKAVKEEVRNSIYNFAFFAPVNTAVFDGGNGKKWLESMYAYRQNLITQEGVCASRNFFYSLNKAMEGKDIQTGKNIMDSLVTFPHFAFNNFGRIDAYVGAHESFNIIDFDVQDGTPAQEIRYFTLADTFYINPTFFDDSGVDLKIFWSAFEEKIMQMLA